jgi:putative tryptophan/tyrosine transport system substrate-binding protein
VRRRDFIRALGAAAAALPVVANAQQKVPLVGFLGSTAAGNWGHFVAAFRAGLKETGFIEGENVALTFRWADGQYDRLPGLAGELVRQNVDVLVATGGLPTIMAAKAATTTIPIVFTVGTDPVATGLVASLNRPGGNITGAQLFTATIDTKRFGLLHDMTPNAALTAVLVNPKNPNVPERSRQIEAAARTLGKRIHFLQASTPQELEQAFTNLGHLQAGALFVGADPFLNTSRETVVSLAARHAIPAIYEHRDFAVAGGLMSYGTDFLDSYRQAGIYAGRILKGEKPADLPVVQSAKFEFVINLKTARALGIEVPPGVSAQADEIIE